VKFEEEKGGNRRLLIECIKIRKREQRVDGEERGFL